MAEEDDGRIRVLQSLRGKICKCDLYVYCSPPTPPLSSFRAAEEVEKEEGRRQSHRGRAAGGARRSVEAEADTRRSSAPVPT